MQWHSKPIEEIFLLLASGRGGLSHEEAKLRYKKLGPNKLNTGKGNSFFTILIRQFFNPLILILLGATFLKFGLEDSLNGIVLALTISIMVVIGFVQELRAVRAMKALKALAAQHSKVKREEQVMLVLSEMLVPGDILILEAGDKVPADARLIEVANFKVNESTLTGESNPVEKHTRIIAGEVLLGERKNRVYMGTIVACGRALAVVTATGSYTELGRIAKTMQGEKEKKTPLQTHIDGIGFWMLAIVGVAVLIFALLGFYHGMPWLDVLLLSIAAAICAIPEGLPAAVTVCLASGVHAMAKKKAIIRKLIAVETLGSTTMICCDKTGTLTLNELTVQALYVPRCYREKPESLREELFKNLLECAVLCNDALLTKNKEKLEVLGDPTEAALLKIAYEAEIYKEELETLYPRIDTLPFASENLYMATLHATDKWHRIILKGAPEKILSLCAYVLRGDKKETLSQEERNDVLQEVGKMADKAYRVIAVGFCEQLSQESYLEEKFFVDKLVFVGCIAMTDPPREEAKKALELCRRAGVQVAMMTGDNVRTAQAIAKQLQMPTSALMTGEQIKNLKENELREVLQKTRVFARVEPLHKLEIVKAFQNLGHVVAVTGDGVNDAPALEAADIGVAMGKEGTDVAKEASDMVLSDDNFSSIVAAIEEGRVIFNRLRNICTFLLITCFGELLGLILSVLFTGKSPLLPIQILWINLVTGVMVAIPIALEPKQGNELMQPPRDTRVHLIFTGMLWQIAFIATLLGLSIFGIFYYTQGRLDLMYARTLILCSVVVGEWFIAYNCRSDEFSFFQLGICKNKWLFFAILGGVIVQAGVIYCPLFYPLFYMKPLSWQGWLIAFIPGLGIFFLETLRKLFFPKLFSYGKWKKRSF